MSFFENLLGAAAGYYNQDQAAKAALELGERGAQELSRLGTEVAGMTEFRPFTVMTGTGTVTTTPTGGIDVGLSPEQQAMRDRLFSQAGTMFDFAASDPSVSQAEMYETIRGIQRPEEERKRLALEERMLSQGRLGLRSDAYGGATPEMLARAQAEEQAKLAASLGAREAAMGERKQAFDTASGLFKQAYLPETMALEALGMGTNVAQLADIGRRSGAEFFGQAGLGGIEALMQGAELAAGLESGKRQTLTEALLGREPTIQEQLVASSLGLDLGSLDTGGLFGGLGSFLGGLFGGSNSSDSGGYTSISPVATQIGQEIPEGINNLGNLF